jgi:hypothetical protein
MIMCLQYTYQAACKRATQLGATVEDGENDWTQAVGFPSVEVAWYFQAQFNGMDSVGAFPEERGSGFSVQFR